MRGLDFSTYFTQSVAASGVQALVAQGFEFAWMGYDTSPVSLAVQQTMMANGFRAWAPYRFLYGNEAQWGSVESQVDNVVTAVHTAIDAGSVWPPFVALDVEKDTAGQAPSIDQITRAMDRMEQQWDITPLSQVKPVIYSALWVWTSLYPGWTLPARRGWGLIAAQWNGVADLNVSLFGGWPAEMVVGHQYAGNVASAIGSIDLDWFADAAPTPPPPPVQATINGLTAAMSDGSSRSLFP